MCQLQAASSCPLKEVFLMVPSISRWQWHPISIAGSEPDSATGKAKACCQREVRPKRAMLVCGLIYCILLMVRLSAGGSTLTLNIKHYGKWTKVGCSCSKHVVLNALLGCSASKSPAP